MSLVVELELFLRSFYLNVYIVLIELRGKEKQQNRISIYAILNQTVTSVQKYFAIVMYIFITVANCK